MKIKATKMGFAWLVSLMASFLRSYPEIIVASACFFFIGFSRRRRHDILFNWPVLGMLPSVFLNVHNLHQWGTEKLREGRGTFVFKGPWLTGMEVLVTCDPANVNYILNSNFLNYPKGSDFIEIFDVLGDGIFNADSEWWSIQRKVAHNFISYRGFKRFVAKSCREKVENGIVPILEHVMQQGKAMDLQDLMQRFTFDSTCILVFGIDPGCLSTGFPTVPFAKAMDEAEEALLFRHTMPPSWWKLLRWLHVGEEKKMAKAKETLDHFISQYISMKREELKARPRSHPADDEAVDLLTSYMDYRLDDEMGIYDSIKSDKFLRDTALNLMIAGRDTTSAALSWFFWLLSQNPSVETKIIEELRTVSPKNEVECRNKARVFDVEEITGLVYLHAALCEALRLYPPVHLGHKGVVQPDILPTGHRVRPGMKILYSSYAMGRMESVWGKDGGEFRPERWISDRGRFKFEPSYKFLAFHAGPRSCLGKDVAFYQMKAVAAAILYNFNIHVVKGQTVVPKISIILHMNQGLMVNVTNRCD